MEAKRNFLWCIILDRKLTSPWRFNHVVGKRGEKLLYMRLHQKPTLSSQENHIVVSSGENKFRDPLSSVVVPCVLVLTR